MRDPKLYLKDILEAIEAIECFVGGVDLETFRNDDMRVSAVIRKFEIIGEAAKNVPESIKQKHSSIPWGDMSGMRDRLIHFYFGIKYELVWNTIKEGYSKDKTLGLEGSRGLRSQETGEKKVIKDYRMADKHVRFTSFRI